MTQRVLITGGQAAAMTVSLPGIDVTTANCDQTCFDSRWSGLTPYLKGTLTVQGLTSGNASAQLLFGETLDVPPLFFGFGQVVVGGVPSGDFGTTPYMLRGNGTDEWFYVQVGVSSLVAMVNNWGSSQIRFTFALFKRPAG